MTNFPKSTTLRTGENLMIRTATSKDIPGILEYLSVARTQSPFGNHLITVELLGDLIAISNAKNSNCLVLIAEVNDRIVGRLTLTGHNEVYRRHSAELSISLSKDYWGLGAGPALIKECFVRANAIGVVKIDLIVRSNNTRAIGLYQKMGFMQEGCLSKEVYIEGSYYDYIVMGIFLD